MILGLKKIWKTRRRSAMYDDSVLSDMLRLLSILFFILIAHTSAMVYLEGMRLHDAFWLTMTSATTVGYGDLSAKTLSGRFATIFLLYIGGIAILAQVAALYFEYRQENRQRMLMGDWSWKMENHIVFLNCPDEMDTEYFYQAISALRRSHTPLAKLPIVIICDRFKEGLPKRLRELNVVHVSKPLSSRETLESADIEQAHTLVVLSRDYHDSASDSINFDLVDRLRDMGVKGRIIAEVVLDTNRARLKKIGADSVLRPIRAYPELLMRAIVSPGAEQVIETLFNSYGEECMRYDVPVTGLWRDIVHKFIDKDLGIPIAYEDQDGYVRNSPSSASEIAGRALFVIVNEGRDAPSSEIEHLLQA